jgi:NAD-dependent DNA ligase
VYAPVAPPAPADEPELPAEVEPEAEEAEAEVDEVDWEDAAKPVIADLAEGEALEGMCYVVCGDTGVPYAELTARLQAQGAIIAETVTIGVDAVILGKGSGDDFQAKLDAAERYDVPTVAYAEIAKLL